MRDLRDFFTPDMTATIGGHTYTVKSPTAHDGLRLAALMNDPERAQKETTDLKEINILFRGDSDDPDALVNEGTPPTGGLWDELWENGATFAEAIHLGLTAIMYYALGEAAAEVQWESVGKGEHATTEEAAKEPTPTKKTTQMKTTRKKTSS